MRSFTAPESSPVHTTGSSVLIGSRAAQPCRALFRTVPPFLVGCAAPPPYLLTRLGASCYGLFRSCGGMEGHACDAKRSMPPVRVRPCHLGTGDAVVKSIQAGIKPGLQLLPHRLRPVPHARQCVSARLPGIKRIRDKLRHGLIRRHLRRGRLWLARQVARRGRLNYDDRLPVAGARGREPR